MSGALCVMVCACAGRRGAERDDVMTFEHGGLTREYILSRPPGDAAVARPLVIYLHGGAGTADKAQRTGGFEALAAQRGFYVLYPQAVGGAWNVGFGDSEERKAAREAASVDDVSFLLALLEHVERQVSVERGRVYVTGVSRGAMMTHRLVCEHAELFAGAGPMIGGMPASKEFTCAPSRPVPMVIVQGDADPLVPYEGGAIDVFGRTGGEVWATEETARRWRGWNGCSADEAPVERLFDVDPDDGLSAVGRRWSRGCEAAPVELVRVRGGGHTWPGGRQYLPRRIIGAASKDLSAPELLWASWSALAP